MRARPFVSRNRALLNIGYATPFDKWKFDFTTHWIGTKRIPGTQAELGRETNSPAYVAFNAQVTKTFRKWDWYVGGENLGNFRQMNPIVNAENPFSRNFDASLVWGPVVGRMIYTGVRYRIK